MSTNIPSALNLYKALLETRSLKGYSNCKALALTIAGYYLDAGAEYFPQAERILNCAPYLVMVPELAEGQCIVPGKALSIIPHVMDARWCRTKYCPTCIKVKSAKWAVKFLKVMPRVQADFPNAEFLFLTLTIKKRPLTQLRKTTRELNTAWKRFQQRKNFPAVGFIRSFEVTAGRGKLPDGSQGAHAHFHVLMMVNQDYFSGPDYLSAEQWGQMWKEAMRLDYQPSVKIQKVRANERRGTGSLISAVTETAKYCVKPGELAVSQEFLLGCTEALHNIRTISLGGIFKNYIRQADIDKIDDELGEVGNEYQMDGPRFRLEWDEEEGRYLCSEEFLEEMMLDVPSYAGVDFESLEFD